MMNVIRKLLKVFALMQESHQTAFDKSSLHLRLNILCGISVVLMTNALY